jgi:tetratricopeptide (TPR) repeat protein
MSSSFRKVLELEVDYLPALNSFASALAALGRYDEAVVEFENLRIAPDNPSILNNYGHALFLMGRLTRRAILEQAASNRIRRSALQPGGAAGIDGTVYRGVAEYEQAASLKPACRAAEPARACAGRCRSA